MICIFGTGILGTSLKAECDAQGVPVVCVSKQDIDFSTMVRDELVCLFHNQSIDHRWVVVNAAAFTNVGRAETQKQQCYEVNTIAPQMLAQLCFESNLYTFLQTTCLMVCVS